MDLGFELITTYGYVAIFLLLMLGIVGLPVPDETLLVFGGYLGPLNESERLDLVQYLKSL